MSQLFFPAYNRCMAGGTVSPGIDWSTLGAQRNQRFHRVRPPDPVRLLDVEPGLGEGLSAPQRDAAARRLAVPSLRVGTGPWAPPRELRAALGIVVVDGLVTLTSQAFGLTEARLFGPGDVFSAELLGDGDRTGAWAVLVPAHMGVLGPRVASAASMWPPVVSELARWLLSTQREAHRLASIRALPRVEDRILALLAHLASRWGRVTPTGVAISLPVTHQVLGHLVAARRPTVSLAITALRERGTLIRMDDGRWLLPPESGDWTTNGLPRAGR
jgi:CRP-like cAMP-binding protein